MLKSVLALLAILFLSACDPQVAASAGGAAPVTTDDPRLGTAAVAPSQALQAFDAVCGATLSARFNGSDAAMVANGFTDRWARTGTVYAPAFNASFKIADEGSDRICSLVFESKSNDSATVSAFAAVSGTPLRRTSAGVSTGTYRDTGATLIIRTSPSTQGGLTIIRLVSNR